MRPDGKRIVEGTIAAHDGHAASTRAPLLPGLPPEDPEDNDYDPWRALAAQSVDFNTLLDRTGIFLDETLADDQPVRKRHQSGDDFSWSERSWETRKNLRRIGVKTASLLIIALAAIVIGAASVAVATRVARRAPSNIAAANTTSGPNSGVVLQPVGGNSQATPGPLAYTIGTWLSNSSPGSEGSVKVFVRVTYNTKPVVGAPVTLSLTGGRNATYGPKRTNSQGMVTFTVTYATPLNNSDLVPYFVTVSTTVESNRLSADTTFVPHVSVSAEPSPQPGTSHEPPGPPNKKRRG